MKAFFLFFAIFILPTVAHADFKDYYYQRYLKRLSQKTDRILAVKPFTFEQYINPDDPSAGVFNQRYFVDKEFAKGTDSPVLFFLCGEASCDNGELGGEVAEHARRLGAYLVSLEHRYYGQSQPFPDQLTADTLRYLTLDNALKDAARFESFLQSKMSLTGPWIVVGGSYAGALSADYRLKYPQLVAGSLASSAPVEARDNFEDYDKYVGDVAGPDCAPLMRAVSKSLEDAMENPTEFSKYKALFKAEQIEDPIDFLYVVADMGAIAIQYGYRDELCDALMGARQADLVSTYAGVGKKLFKLFQITPLQDSVQGALSTETKTYTKGLGMRQWYYQSCTQFGYWQTAYHDPEKSVRSAKIDIAYHRNLCQRLFKFSNAPDTEYINSNYYYPLQKGGANHILFTNGSRDPWSQLSITKSENPALDLFMILGGAHCDDLSAPNGDSSSLKQAKKLFETLVKSWISSGTP